MELTEFPFPPPPSATPWATWVRSRNPQFKVYPRSGPARQAMSWHTHSPRALYRWNQDTGAWVIEETRQGVLRRYDPETRTYIEVEVN